VLSALGCIGLALMFMLPPLFGWRRPQLQKVGSNQVNLDVFHQQLAELEQDLVTGVLDQDQYNTARQDLERALVNDTKDPLVLIPAKSGRWAIPVLVLGVPMLAVGLYVLAGDYQAIDRPAVQETAVQPNLESMRQLVDRLAERMEANPEDLRGWLMLGRSALMLGQAERAVNAYAQANRLAPQDPEVLLAYADVLARVTKKFAGRPTELIKAALEINPEHPQALWFMGLAEMELGATAKALEYWDRLAAKLPPNSEEAKALQRLITKTRQGLIATPTP
jgi:cytochrome c-type biogenesis protein CcmH